MAGRSRLLIEVVDAVRAVWPNSKPLFVRVSATDWVEGGLNVDDGTDVARTLAEHGVDLIDLSSGGNCPEQKIEVGPSYQVPFAAQIRRESGLAVAAVGLITEPAQAEKILVDDDDDAADAVLLARAVLREPTWPQRAAAVLGDKAYWPPQYQRARLG